MCTPIQITRVPFPHRSVDRSRAATALPVDNAIPHTRARSSIVIARPSEVGAPILLEEHCPCGSRFVNSRPGRTVMMTSPQSRYAWFMRAVRLLAPVAVIGCGDEPTEQATSDDDEGRVQLGGSSLELRNFDARDAHNA